MSQSLASRYLKCNATDCTHWKRCTWVVREGVAAFEPALRVELRAPSVEVLCESYERNGKSNS